MMNLNINFLNENATVEQVKNLHVAINHEGTEMSIQLCKDDISRTEKQISNLEKAENKTADQKEKEREAINSKLDDLKEQLSSKDGYKADQITTDNYEGKYVISGVTGVVRGTLSYDYKVTYQKEDVTVGDMNGTVDGSSQMSAEFVYKDGNYQLRTVNPGSIWYRESQ